MKIAAHIRSELHLSMECLNISSSDSGSSATSEKRWNFGMMKGLLARTHTKLSLGEFRAFISGHPCTAYFHQHCDQTTGSSFSCP